MTILERLEKKNRELEAKIKKLQASLERLKRQLEVKFEELTELYKKVYKESLKFIGWLCQSIKKAKVFVMKNPEITEKAIKITIRAINFICFNQDDDEELYYANSD